MDERRATRISLRRPEPRPVPAFLALALGLSGMGLLTACQSEGGGIQTPMDAQEKQEDERAKVGYYTDAAKTYYEGGKYEAAVRMWEKVVKATPEDQWAQFGLAKSLHMTGTVQNLRRAEKILVDILPRDWSHPKQGDVRFRVQTTLASVYSDLGDYYDHDVRALDAQLEQEPSKEAAGQLRVQKQKQIAVRNDLLQRSIPLFDQVLASSREDPHALAGLAKAHLLLGSDEAGIGYAKRYLALSQRNQVQWREEMKSWERMSGGKLREDQRGLFISKIHGAREKEKAMHLLLGSVYMRRDAYGDAVAEYDAVIRLDAATPAAYVERAQAYARLNQYPLAVRDLEEYLKLTDPVKQRAGRVNAAELLDRYRRIAGTPAGGPAAPGALQPASAARSPAASVPVGDTGIGSPDGP